MAFQERMSSTAVRRAVADYKAAGINPLMVTKFGGASSPPGASMPAVDELGPAGQAGVNTALSVRRNRAEVANMEETNANLAEQRKRISAEIGHLNAQTANVNADSLIKGEVLHSAKADAAAGKIFESVRKQDDPLLRGSTYVGEVLRRLGLTAGGSTSSAGAWNRNRKGGSVSIGR